MQHKQNIKAIQAQHRIHTQELNDESVIYKSREKTFEIHVNDMEIKYRTMLDIVNQNREKKQDMVTELEMLTNRSRHLDNEIGGLASELSVRERKGKF
jgi:hypothetical protein